MQKSWKKTWLSGPMALLLGAVTAVAVPVLAQHGGSEQITICHATGSAQNPYVKITTSGNAGHGHIDNQGNPLNGHEDDIILSGDVDCPTMVPSPSPSVSPTTSPSPTVSPSVSPSPSPSVSPSPSPSSSPSVSPSPSSSPSPSPSPSVSPSTPPPSPSVTPSPTDPPGDNGQVAGIRSDCDVKVRNDAQVRNELSVEVQTGNNEQNGNTQSGSVRFGGVSLNFTSETRVNSGQHAKSHCDVNVNAEFKNSNTGAGSNNYNGS